MSRFGLPGKVYLLGVGSGLANSLSDAALTVLRQAQVVLHDEGVLLDVLEQVPTSCLVLCAGGASAEEVSQTQINERMIAFADEGKIVVRLRGGDLVTLGRAQEEMQALREAGIHFEIIAGVASAPTTAAAA